MNHQAIIPQFENKELLPENLNLSPAEMKEVMQEAHRMMDLLLKTIRTRFEVLETEFRVKNQHNPISFITARIKSNQSIIGKMARKGLPFSIEDMEKNILDIAGIRILNKFLQ